MTCVTTYLEARRTMLTAALLAGAMALLAGCAPEGGTKKKKGKDALPPPPKPDRVLSVLAERAGTISEVVEPTRVVVRPGAEGEDQPALPGIPLEQVAADAAQTLERRAGGAGETEVMLLVWAMGEKPSGGFGVDISAVQLFGSTLVVRAHLREPGADEMVTEALTYPFHVVAVPAVAFEEVYWHRIRPMPRLYEAENPPDQADDASR